MGRPWWYDSYWEKGKRPKRRFRLPGRQSLVWIVLLLVSLVLAMNSNGFHPVWSAWLTGFVFYLCSILALAILVRAILSWFRISRYNRLVILLYDVTDPVLSPLRRVIPPVGAIDITPLIAMIILYFIPTAFNWLIDLFI